MASDTITSGRPRVFPDNALLSQLLDRNLEDVDFLAPLIGKRIDLREAECISFSLLLV
jgi:hypothetical protein